MKLDPNAPAYPATQPNEYFEKASTYHPVRADFAKAAMQSLISNLSLGAELQRLFDRDRKIQDAISWDESPQNYLARIAIAQADALIAELNRTTP